MPKTEKFSAVNQNRAEKTLKLRQAVRFNHYVTPAVRIKYYVTRQLSAGLEVPSWLSNHLGMPWPILIHPVSFTPPVSSAHSSSTNTPLKLS